MRTVQNSLLKTDDLLGQNGTGLVATGRWQSTQQTPSKIHVSMCVQVLATGVLTRDLTTAQKIRISIVTIFRFCDEMFFKQLVVKFDIYNQFVPQRHLNPRSTSAFATSGAAPSRATFTHSTDGNWLRTFSRCFSTWFSTCP